MPYKPELKLIKEEPSLDMPGLAFSISKTYKIVGLYKGMPVTEIEKSFSSQQELQDLLTHISYDDMFYMVEEVK